MTRKFMHVTLAFAIALCVLAVAVSAKVRPTDSRLEQAERFSTHVGITGDGDATSTRVPSPASVGAVAQPAVDSRGALIAKTWRDWQAHINAGNSIAFNPKLTPAGPSGLHFTYTMRPSTSVMNRFGYASFDPVSGTFPLAGGVIIVNDNSPTSQERGEYPRVTVYPADGAAIVSGVDQTDYNNAATWQVQTVIDAVSLAGVFGDITGGTIVDNVEALPGSWTVGDYQVRPKSALTVTGTDTVMYVATRGLVPDDNSQFAIKVFRKAGTSVPALNPDPAWDLVFVDTSSNASQEITTDPGSANVAIVWTKFANDDITSATGEDVWYAISPSGLSGTWVKTNLTNLTLSSPNIPWTLVSTIFDSQGKLHILYPAGLNDDGSTYSSIICKLWHWSQQDNKTSLVYDATWPLSSVCGRTGSNVMNVGRTAIAECNNRLYVTFSSRDSMLTGYYDDCAISQSFTYSGNAEVFMTISKDLTGKSWDRPRNLSNSYTPNCDTGLTATPCADDQHGSLTQFGMRDADYAGTETWPASATYDASGSYTGEWWLHLLYLTDRYPGYGGAGTNGNPGTQGPNTENDVRWIRLACVPPVVAANVVVSPATIIYPEFTHPSTPKNYTIRLENQGNADATSIVVTDIEDSTRGAVVGATNWMSLSATPVIVPETQADSFTVTLNAGGVVTAGPTVLYGKIRIQYSWTSGSNQKDVPINFVVADTIAFAAFDTISTSCLDLVLGSNGDMGNSGGDGSSGADSGRYNMDYFGSIAECDTGLNGRGSSRVYLYDASPIIIRKTSPTTYRGSWSAFSADLATPNGFRPMLGVGYAPHAAFSTASVDGFNSGTYVTVDSLVKLESTWWAPKHADSCNFIIHRTRVFPANIASSVSALQIGQIADFDVPSDSGGSGNVSGTDNTRRLIWARGFNSADTVTDCTDNSRRYAGMALLNWHMKNKACSDVLYSGASIANDAYVYGGLSADSMARVMHVAGMSAEPRTTDVTMLLTVQDGATGYTLPANDTLSFYTALATVRTAANTAVGLDSLKAAIDKAKNFLKKNLGVCASCCIGVTGNVNTAGIVDLSDLSSLVSYLTGGGYVLPCVQEANVNNAGIVDLSDLSSLVSYLTGGGYVLPNCG